MREIPLANGRGVALVDDEDYERLAQYSWCLGARRYAQRRSATGIVWMHREVLNAPPDKHVDHADGDTLNNTKANLRLCERWQNMANARKPAIDRPPTSQYRGVSYAKPYPQRPWRADIKVNGQRILIGYYLTELEAAHAYDAAQRQHRGSFAKLNFPDAA